MTECKILKKCPECKKKMDSLINGLGDYEHFQICVNDKCKFYGIRRFCPETSYAD